MFINLQVQEQHRELQVPVVVKEDVFGDFKIPESLYDGMASLDDGMTSWDDGTSWDDYFFNTQNDPYCRHNYSWLMPAPGTLSTVQFI